MKNLLSTKIIEIDFIPAIGFYIGLHEKTLVLLLPFLGIEIKLNRKNKEQTF